VRGEVLLYYAFPVAAGPRFPAQIIEREEGTLVILALSTSSVYWAARYRIMSDILRGD